MWPPRLTASLEGMNPLTVNPAIALDHARRANAEAVRTAEQHRRQHALREADPRRTDPRPPWWRRWTPRPPDPRRPELRVLRPFPHDHPPGIRPPPRHSRGSR